VSAPGSGTPTGTLVFRDGSTILGTATLSSAQATLGVGTLSKGNHTITAAYGGDTHFSPSTSPGYIETIGGKPGGGGFSAQQTNSTTSGTATATQPTNDATSTTTSFPGRVRIGNLDTATVDAVFAGLAVEDPVPILTKKSLPDDLAPDWLQFPEP